MPPYIGSFRGGPLRMRAVTEPYPPASIVGAIILSRLGIPSGRHALGIEAVGLVTNQLGRLPSRGEYKKVIQLGNQPTRLVAKPRQVRKGHTP